MTIPKPADSTLNLFDLEQDPLIIHSPSPSPLTLSSLNLPELLELQQNLQRDVRIEVEQVVPGASGQVGLGATSSQNPSNQPPPNHTPTSTQHTPTQNSSDPQESQTNQTRTSQQQ